MKKIKYFNTVTGDTEAGLISNLVANGTLEDANLLVIEQSAELKKVSLEDVTDFIGGALASKFNVVTFTFDKSTTGFYGSAQIPQGAILTKMSIKVDVILTGTAYIIFDIQATVDIALGIETTHFLSEVGFYEFGLGNSVIGADNVGSFGYTVSGTPTTGSGTAWIEYYTI